MSLKDFLVVICDRMEAAENSGNRDEAIRLLNVAMDALAEAKAKLLKDIVQTPDSFTG
jgi:hypothetical protein